MRAVDSTNLATSVKDTARGLVRQYRFAVIRPHDVGQPGSTNRKLNAGSVDTLKVLTRWGCRPCASQMRWTVAAANAGCLGHRRQLQWVAPDQSSTSPSIAMDLKLGDHGFTTAAGADRS